MAYSPYPEHLQGELEAASPALESTTDEQATARGAEEPG